jgi:tetratricopeptide (TPR) repeat protein
MIRQLRLRGLKLISVAIEPFQDMVSAETSFLVRLTCEKAILYLLFPLNTRLLNKQSLCFKIKCFETAAMITMKKSICFYIFFIISATGWAVDTDSDQYGSITDYLNSIYGVDSNAGLTAFPILNIPIGGHSEAMAGAYSAVADDVSFIEWNPAGSSMLEISELAFFHNNWIADAKIEALAYAAHLKDFGIGVSGKWLYMPFTQYGYFGDRLSKGYYSEAVAVLNGSYQAVPNYYFGEVSFGVNLKGAFRSTPDYADESGIVKSGSGQEQSAAAVMADTGFLTRFNLLKFYNSRDRNTSAALVVRNLGAAALGDPLPTVAVTGFSYRPIRPMLMSFDFSVPLNLTDINLSEDPYWAAGFSLTATNFLSMLMGLLMKTGNIRVSVGSAVDLHHISFDVNYTLDLLTQVQPLNRVALGVHFNLGDNNRKSNRELVDEYYLAGLEAYSQMNDAEARVLFQKALEINPHFTPAAEALKALEDYEKLSSRINALRRLDY